MSQENIFNLEQIHKNHEIEELPESPINIDVTISTIKILPPLIWNNFDKTPIKMKITNSGQTRKKKNFYKNQIKKKQFLPVIISGKWNTNRPYLTGGSLNGKYVFSQIHFHWGKSALEGSEHTIDGNRLPLEMHAVLFKSSYLNQNEAIDHPDGIITLAYFFQIKSNHSSSLHRFLSEVDKIKMADTAVLIEPFLLTELLFPFENDYYLYTGKISSKEITHQITWLITREVSFISFEQLGLFRYLMDRHLRPIYRNFREISSKSVNQLFHINPAYKFTNTTLSTVPSRRIE